MTRSLLTLYQGHCSANFNSETGIKAKNCTDNLELNAKRTSYLNITEALQPKATKGKILARLMAAVT